MMVAFRHARVIGGLAAACRRLVPGLDRRGRGAHGRRVLILRPTSDGLGDLVLFSGVLRHLRTAFSGCEITLAVAETSLSLFKHCPYVDVLIRSERFSESEPYALSSRWPSLRSALRYIRNAGIYSRVVFWWRAMGLEHHALAATFLPAKLFGIAGDRLFQTDAEDASVEHLYEDRFRLSDARKWDHELEINLEFLRFLGADVGGQKDIHPEFWLGEEDGSLVGEWLGGRPKGELKVACAPCTSKLAKDWPAERFARILHELSPCTVLLLGTSAHSSSMATIMRESPENVRCINLAGQTSARQLVSAVGACDLFVGVDTAPLHMAIALRKPSLGIIGGGHYGRYVPWGDPAINRFVHVGMDCYGCNWHCRYPIVRCIDDVSVSRVRAELELLLKDTLALRQGVNVVA